MDVYRKSIEYLRRNLHLRALSSVWHIRSYTFGVQAALQILDPVLKESRPEFDGLREVLRGNFVGNQSEFDAIWQCSVSPQDSARIFLERWDAFFRDIPTTGREANSLNVSSCLIDLDNKLPNIETRPAFYFATADVSHLKAWVEGVEFVAHDFGNIEIRPDLKLFGEWVKSNSGSSASCPWDMLLTSSCGGDMRAALTLFFEELRRFRQ